MKTSNYGKNTVTIIDPKSKEEISYYLEPWVREKFDKKIIPELQYKDKDCFIAFDGKEGSGKSTLALQWCKYVDNSFDLSRVVFTPEDFTEAIIKAKKGQAVCFDEAFTGFSSRSALSGINRTLVSLMMQIRQKNLFVAIVLPTIFQLDKYLSLFRTRVLVHVFENRGRRGFFRVYSSKKKTQLILHKLARSYSYGIRTNKKGRFYGVFALGKEEEKKYREKKLKSLELKEKNTESSKLKNYRDQRDITIYIIKNKLKLSYREVEKLLKEYNFEISYVQIRTICSKFEKK